MAACTNKRYCIERLIAYDDCAKLETWKRTKVASLTLSALENFMAEDYRIFDMIKNKEVKRNVNLKTWL